MNVYEYEARIEELEDLREEAIASGIDENGEISEEALREINALTVEKLETEFERDEWITSYAMYIKELERTIKDLREAEKEKADRRRALEKKMEKSQEFLAGFLDGRKFENANVKITWRSSDKVVTTDEFTQWAMTNDAYLRYKAPEVDKTALKTALKQGVEIPGAYIEKTNNMSIKD